MSIKDLKIAYNVLCDLDYPVPTELLQHLSQTIRTTETQTTQRRLSRMTDEQLLRLDRKACHKLRIYTSDGRLIQKPTTEETFREAIRRIGPDRVVPLGLKHGRKPVIRFDETRSRRRIRGYYFLAPGYFLVCGTSSAEQHAILSALDAHLRLNWEIELV